MPWSAASNRCFLGISVSYEHEPRRIDHSPGDCHPDEGAIFRTSGPAESVVSLDFPDLVSRCPEDPSFAGMTVVTGVAIRDRCSWRVRAPQAHGYLGMGYRESGDQ
jgi:hypothetical protein